ncbi:hypothetical protein BCV70DRAFT_197465 [Testicularia cyperi]|uniref:dolichyl-phosphate beta-glucosyltransferase n=1 Tax=Testicularia cyperi TaxID=1882483 RepID=A0A317XY56_9BASI|nr:hypothetical protein BCV70DRAFT_197465 [Testicularia cyperi]
MGAACCAGAALSGGAAAAGPSSMVDGTIWGFLSAIPIAVYHFYPKLTVILATLLVLGASTLYVVLVLLTPVQKQSSPSELTFLSAASDKPHPLPSFAQDHEQDQDSINAPVQLSIVIPAYNETERMTTMLDEAFAYLQDCKSSGRCLADVVPDSSSKTTSNGNGNGKAKANGHVHAKSDGSRSGQSAAAARVSSALLEPLVSYEVLIVDDGSKDDTHKLALDYAKSHPDVSSAVRVVRLTQNRGKGGAVRHGVLHSRGNVVLFADADGATRFADLSKLARRMADIATRSPAGHGIVVGSRAHMVKSDAVVKRSFVRNLLMHGFHLFLSLLLRPPTLSSLQRKILGSSSKSTTQNGSTKTRQLPTQPEIKDTQCGFKLFTRPTAKLVFPYTHIDGWIFDVEILILAQTASQLALSADPSMCPATPQLGCSRDSDDDDNDDLLEGEEKERAKEEADPLLGLPIPIAEVPVHWVEVGGSKIDLLRDSIRMALDLLVIRFNYATGRWKSPPPAL